LQNKGAMAGTFAVVTLAGVTIIGALIFFLIKRQRRRRDEADVDAYFDKPVGASGYNSGIGHSSASLEFPPAHRQFNSTNVNYNDPQSYGMDFPPDTSSFNSRPGSAAPGTAYAAAIAQQGPYQYNGKLVHLGGSDAGPSARSGPFADQPRPLSTDEAYDPYYVR